MKAAGRDRVVACLVYYLYAVVTEGLFARMDVIHARLRTIGLKKETALVTYSLD